ncbi:cation:proton antiporter [Francisella marina]|uniref:Sodium:proton antiporter n=1 Tax=Francisella marina TaxID=2249302 RepID=A0ABX5ZIW5_9GAMM|nr:sodium:proton antiporter [Francisella marina]QEO57971.1 sodium:proton antiporter [Francisella marina]QEO59802.1 sodium:proton antiporter [Francisella marina]
MSLYSLFVLLCVIAAYSSYFNLRFLGLPKSIGLTALSAFISLSLLVLIKLEPNFFSPVYDMLDSVNFKTLVLKVLLGYLLFASAMHLDFSKIRKFSLPIAVLSSLGVVVTAFIMGTLCWFMAPLVVGVNISYVHCLMVGAVLSPTDPVTVFAVFKSTKAVPEKVKAILSGEAIFNDVFSIVLFLILLSIITNSNQNVSISEFVIMLFQEGAGGIVLGMILGFFGARVMSNSDDTHTLIIMSLAIVSVGSWLATRIEVSEPLVMVVCGMVIGNSKPRGKISEESRKGLSSFWAIVDELLNTFLFVLIGIVALKMSFSVNVLIAGAILFIIALVARYLSVIFSMFLVDRSTKNQFWKNGFVITWAGLRGGVSIALALTIPIEYRSDHASSIVYIAVLLSIFIQGVSFRKVLDKAYAKK